MNGQFRHMSISTAIRHIEFWFGFIGFLFLVIPAAATTPATTAIVAGFPRRLPNPEVPEQLLVDTVLSSIEERK
jgi:hypothetical protein